MPAKSSGQASSGSSGGGGSPGTLRIIAAVLWALAIGGEAFAIFRILRANPVNMTLLIGALVVIGVLAIVGDLLWKRANAMDPASTSEPVRFFIQNQLGAIIGIIAFLPLVLLIVTNKNMSGQQKTLAGGIGVIALIVATMMGVSFNPPSVEQYAQQTAIVQATEQAAMPQTGGTAMPVSNGTPGAAAQASGDQYASEAAVVIGYTGQDLVYWKADSTVYHLCQQVSALSRTNATNNTIYSGTVAQAHAAGMTRLTLEVQSELKECGYSAAASPTP